MTNEELIQLKQQINSAKEKLQKLEGRKETLLETMKKDFGCSNLKQAKAKIQEFKELLEDLQEKRNKMVADLEEEYEID